MSYPDALESQAMVAATKDIPLKQKALRRKLLSMLGEKTILGLDKSFPDYDSRT